MRRRNSNDDVLTRKCEEDLVVTKYEKYGVLHVDAKGQLVDRNGEVVVLRGFSTHGLSWYPEYVIRDIELQERNKRLLA